MIFAALMGRAEIAKMLLAAGADINATDDNGTNALTVAELDWQTTEDIAGMFQIPLTNPEAIKKGKAEIAKMLRAGALGSARPGGRGRSRHRGVEVREAT